MQNFQLLSAINLSPSADDKCGIHDDKLGDMQFITSKAYACIIRIKLQLRPSIIMLDTDDHFFRLCEIEYYLNIFNESINFMSYQKNRILYSSKNMSYTDYRVCFSKTIIKTFVNKIFL